MTIFRSDHYHFGKGFKQWITDSGFKQRFIAQKLGVSPQMLCQWCKSRDIRLSTAIKICEGTGLSLMKLQEISCGILGGEQPAHEG